MSNELSAHDLLPPEMGLTLLRFEKSEKGWLVRAEGRTRSECPSCGAESTARHSRYWRHLQDLPVQGKEVALRLRLSRWRCRNGECEQAIFRERLGEFPISLRNLVQFVFPRQSSFYPTIRIKGSSSLSVHAQPSNDLQPIETL